MNNLNLVRASLSGSALRKDWPISFLRKVSTEKFIVLGGYCADGRSQDTCFMGWEQKRTIEDMRRDLLAKWILFIRKINNLENDDN